MRMIFKTSAFHLQLLAVIIFFGTLSGCKKEIALDKNIDIYTESKEKVHKEKIELWFKLIPLKGKFSGIDFSKIKTVYKNEQLTTRLPIGGNGSSFYFISSKDKFHVYAVNTQKLKILDGYNGVVDIYDFQTISKKGILYRHGKIENILEYKSSKPIINAYKNQYQIIGEQPVEELVTNELIGGIRKFFCELFGGYWSADIAGNATNSSGSCSTGGTGTNEVQNLPPPEAGGNEHFGIIWTNLNNPSYFDATSSFWNNITAGLNAGGNVDFANTSSYNLDPAFLDQEKIRSLYYILNTKYNQQPASLHDGTLQEMLLTFKDFSNSAQPPVPIIPLLLKATANGAADALMQALFIYLTEDDCVSFGAAFGHDKFNGLQVTRSSVEGLIPWRTPGGKLGRAAATASGDVIANLIQGKYGTSDFKLMGADFMLGFFSDLAGGEVGELASKYAIPKIGKGLVTKFNVPYRIATQWLGGGLQNYAKSYSHLITENGVSRVINITSTRKMVGWNPSKIAVIGRSQDKRVVPFAGKLSSELGIHVHNIKEWSGFSPNLTVEQNKQWVEMLKREGYTIIDIGTDPDFNADKGPYYGMETLEFFGG